MGKYQVHQTDANEPLIIAALEAGGCAVAKIGRPVDLLISKNQRTYVAEVKTTKGKLRPTQAKFIAGWLAPVWILRSVEDVVQFLKQVA